MAEIVQLVVSDEEDEHKRNIENKILAKHEGKFRQRIKEAREDERKQWPRFAQGVVDAALPPVIAAHEKELDRTADYHARQELLARRAAHRSGALMFGVLGALAGGFVVWSSMQLGMFSTIFADKARAEQPYTPPHQLTIHDPTDYGDMSRDSGTAAHGHEPARAP